MNVPQNEYQNLCSTIRRPRDRRHELYKDPHLRWRTKYFIDLTDRLRCALIPDEVLRASQPDFLSKTPNQVFGCGQRNISLQGVLSRNRLGRPVWCHCTVINASGEFVESRTIAAKLRFERPQLKRLQIADGLNAHLLQPALGHLAHAWNAANGQRRQECSEVFRLNDEETIG